MRFNSSALSGFSAKSTIVIALGLLTLALLLFAALGQTSTVSAAAPASQTACTGPTNTDYLDKSGLKVSGPTATWTAQDNACGYRVILRSKPDGKRLDTENTTATSYTIPSDKVTEGSKYSIIIKMLDSRGKVLSKGISMAFIYSATAPTCGPLANDRADKSGLVISGQTVTWPAHANACGYRVILKSKADGKRLAMANTTAASYTIPSDKVTSGDRYSIRIKLLDSHNHVAGKGIAKAFTYQQ